MNKLSERSRFIELLLKEELEPRSMDWIVKKVSTHFLGEYKRNGQIDFHRQIWNSVYSMTATPMKRPKLIKTLSPDGLALFSYNRN